MRSARGPGCGSQGKAWEQSGAQLPALPLHGLPVALGHVPCGAGAEACCWGLFPVPFVGLEGAVCPFSWCRVKLSPVCASSV